MTMCLLGFGKKKEQGKDQTTMRRDLSARLMTFVAEWQSDLFGTEGKQRLQEARDRFKKVLFPRSDTDKIAHLYARLVADLDELAALGVLGPTHTSLLDTPKRSVAECVEDVVAAVTEWVNAK